MWYLTKTPPWIQHIFNGGYWHINTDQKVLYLTFDDGPHPTTTPWLLNTLEKFNARATFFCLGNQAHQHPQLIEAIQQHHTLGNHTYHHLNGWHTHYRTYWRDIQQCQSEFTSHLFRPPYGLLSPAQFQQLKHQFQLIMWDVMPGDFDPRLSPSAVLQNITRNVETGSIIVLHDHPASSAHLKNIVPALLQYYTQRGFQFADLSFLNS